MTTPATASATSSQASPAPVSSPPSGKSQRRMARPPMEGAATAASGATAPSALPMNKSGPSPVPTPSSGTKTAAIIALLKRADGATLAELIAATSWLPHTTRAALTGLRKKGHVIERTKRGDETCYRIVAGAVGATGAADTVTPA